MKNHAPISPNERIALLDVLRGAALFGILLINIHAFHSPSLYQLLPSSELWTSTSDQIVYDIVNFIVQGKFYTLFSFLFGFGFYIFMTRAEQKVGLESKSLYLRRLIILFSFGLIHIIFFWWGDILTWYALAGLLLLAFYKRSSKTLLGWAFGISAIYLMLFSLLYAAAILLSGTAENATAASFYENVIASSSEMYTGSYADAFKQRMSDMSFYVPSVALSAMVSVLPMFLIGLYVARKGWLVDVRQHIRTIRKIWIVTLIVGFGFTIVKQWGLNGISHDVISMSDLYFVIGMIIGDPVLCFFYVASGAMLVYYLPKFALWRWFAAAGRMALTNYLLQTVICTTLFYGYGFGLYGKLGAIELYLICFVIFVLQLIFSRWWMKKYTYGPLEKVWRIGTYGRKG